MSTPFIGQIAIFGFNFPPRAWAQCNGQLLPISQNTALFSLLGTIYGGDGRTTFALPDLRGRSAIHMGTGPGLPSAPIGQRSGSPTATLNANNLPSHTHGNNFKIKASSEDANGDDPSAGVLGVSNENLYNAIADEDASSAWIEGGVLPTGNNQSFSIRDPYLVLNFCIALQGIFPSRN